MITASAVGMLSSRCLSATGGIQLAATVLRCGPKSSLLRVQLYANDARTALRRAPARRRTIKEIITQPAAGDSAFSAGKIALAGASVVGLGSLCYYASGMSKEVGTIQTAMFWPEYVKDRIKSTYQYFGSSIALTAASALAVTRSPAFMNIMMKNSWLAIGATFVAMIGSGMLVRSIPYQEGFGKKQLAWILHTGIMGAVIAPLCLLGGPIVIRAAWYTAGIVGGLSTLAVCAPSDKFMYMGGPLAIGFGVVLVSSLGSMFLSPATALGAGLYSISLYGGLILFSGFMLYDTQRIMHKAETYPMYAALPYDPINQSISIYLDTLNIFVRIVTLLSGGGSRRK